MTTEYIASLSGVQTERPIQSISYSLSGISNWIEETLRKYPEGTVTLECLERKTLRVVRGSRAGLCSCGHEPNLHINITSVDPTAERGACAKLDCTCKHFEIRK